MKSRKDNDVLPPDQRMTISQFLAEKPPTIKPSWWMRLFGVVISPPDYEEDDSKRLLLDDDPTINRPF